MKANTQTPKGEVLASPSPPLPHTIVSEVAKEFSFSNELRTVTLSKEPFTRLQQKASEGLPGEKSGRHIDDPTNSCFQTGFCQLGAFRHVTYTCNPNTLETEAEQWLLSSRPA